MHHKRMQAKSRELANSADADFLEWPHTACKCVISVSFSIFSSLSLFGCICNLNTRMSIANFNWPRWHVPFFTSVLRISRLFFFVFFLFSPLWWSPCDAKNYANALFELADMQRVVCSFYCTLYRRTYILLRATCVFRCLFLSEAFLAFPFL